jgi:hypothetical protein
VDVLFGPDRWIPICAELDEPHVPALTPRMVAPCAGLMRTLYPERRAAVAMVTGHQQPDPRVGCPGRESNSDNALRDPPLCCWSLIASGVLGDSA